MQDEQQLNEGLNRLQISLSETQKTLLLQYLALLQKWNKVYNLTAVRDEEGMLTTHVLDCLSALPLLASRALKILDVGSGGGMPGLIFAIARPDCHLTLLDASHKKTTFLQQSVIDLGLKNVRVICSRVEQVQNESFDVITSRAFSDLKEFVDLTKNLRDADGLWLALKGVYPYEEIAQLPPDIQVQHVHKLSVPFLDAERHVVIMGA